MTTFKDIFHYFFYFFIILFFFLSKFIQKSIFILFSMKKMLNVLKF